MMSIRAQESFRRSLFPEIRSIRSFAAVVAVAVCAIAAPSDLRAGATVSISLEEHLRGASEDERVQVTIVLKSTAGPATDIAIHKSAAGSAVERKKAVVSALKDRAQRTSLGVRRWLEASLEDADLQTMREFWIVDAVTVSLPVSAIEALKHHPDVEAIVLQEPQQVLCASKDLAGTEDYVATPWSIRRVKADSVWHNYGIDGEGILVAMLDTGVDYTHSDLSGRIWTNTGEIPDNSIDDDGNGYIDDYSGYDFALRVPDPMDDDGHGTHTAGSAAGDGTGGLTTGVAPGAQIMVLKVLDFGIGVEDDVWEAIQYAVDNGADVINMSMGWIQCRSHPSRALWRQACENALAAGVVVTAAAGNERDKEGTTFYCDPPEQIRTPADVPGVLAVGAVMDGGPITSFSSEGPVTWESVAEYGDHPYPPGLIKPDFCAPGQYINSTILGGGYSGVTWSGTSMATPHLSGTVALMLQADPELTPAKVDSILRETCVDSGPSGRDNWYGWGRIDALRAVEAVFVGDFPPAAPESLSAEDVPEDEGGRIALRWSRSADDGAGENDVIEYYVYRAQSVDGFADSVHFTVPGGETTAVDSISIADGVYYYYRVYAYDGTRVSLASPAVGPVSARDNLPPEAPTEFRIQSGDHENQLTWMHSGSDNAAGSLIRFRMDTYPIGPADGTFLTIVPGAGGEPAECSHEGLEEYVTYYYAIFAYDGAGNYSVGALAQGMPTPATSVSEDGNGKIQSLQLTCRPNPFNPETSLRFHLPAAQHVRLKIYDPLGRHRTTLCEQDLSAGDHQFRWDGCGDDGYPLASGVYFCRFETEGEVISRKLVLAR